MALSRFSSLEVLSPIHALHPEFDAEAGTNHETFHWENLHRADAWEIRALAGHLSLERGGEPGAAAWLVRLQEEVLGCVQGGEAMAFQLLRREDGNPTWGLQLLATEVDAGSGSALAMDCLLGSHTAELEVRRSTRQDKSPTPWLWLRPVLHREAAGSGLGFQADETNHADWLLPKLTGGVPEQARHVPSLVGPAVGLLDLEIMVRPCQSDAVPWSRAPLSRMRDRRLARLLEQRLGALADQSVWEVVCRMRVESEDAGWGNLLGRLLWNGAARLDAAPPTPEETAACALPKREVPLLLPGAQDARGGSRAPMVGRMPARLPTKGVVLGHAGERLVRLANEGRARHTYLLGGTGTGKSTLLANLISQDIRAGEGVIVIDPHGELVRDVIRLVPNQREKDVHLISPRRPQISGGFNMLALGDKPPTDMEAGFIVGELYSLVECLYNMREVGGPMFELYFRNALKLMIQSQCLKRPTLMDMDRVFVDASYRDHLLEACTDELVVRFWRKQATQAKGDSSLENMTPYIVSKLDGLRNSAFIRQLLSAEKDTLDVRKIMNQRKILLIDASKGHLGLTESRLLGICLMIRIFACALGRTTKQCAIPVRLYVDEFQNFVTDSMAAMLSEARKFGLSLTLANQTLSQLASNAGREDVLASVLGNVGNLIAFRLGVLDAQRLEPFIDPLSVREMQTMPNFHAFARLLDTDGPLEPMIVRTPTPGAFASLSKKGLDVPLASQ
jgi:hypothetical protein